MKDAALKLYATTSMSLTEIGNQLGISRKEVFQLISPTPKSWIKKGKKHRPAVTWTDQEVIEFRKRGWSGESTGDMAKEAGVCRETMADMIYGETYKHLNEISTPTPKDYFRKQFKPRKINDEQIVDLRIRAANGEPREELAKEYNISLSYLSDICCGSKYKRLGGPISRTNKAYNSGKLTESQVIEIRQRVHDGETRTSVARDIGMTDDSISAICMGKTYAHVGGPRTVSNTASLSAKQHSELHRLHGEGYTNEQLCVSFGLKPHTLRRWLKKPLDMKPTTK